MPDRLQDAIWLITLAVVGLASSLFGWIARRQISRVDALGSELDRLEERFITRQEFNAAMGRQDAALRDLTTEVRESRKRADERMDQATASIQQLTLAIMAHQIRLDRPPHNSDTE